ncbi:hypothetical protein SANTM175S_00128 [Streptomyces antimycoticus]
MYSSHASHVHHAARHPIDIRTQRESTRTRSRHVSPSSVRELTRATVRPCCYRRGHPASPGPHSCCRRSPRWSRPPCPCCHRSAPRPPTPPPPHRAHRTAQLGADPSDSYENAIRESGMGGHTTIDGDADGETDRVAVDDRAGRANPPRRAAASPSSWTPARTTPAADAATRARPRPMTLPGIRSSSRSSTTTTSSRAATPPSLSTSPEPTVPTAVWTSAAAPTSCPPRPWSTG